MITEKNKEEIEKSSINVFDIFDELDNIYENKDWSVNEAIELGIRKATIKTSIQWCEDEIEFLNKLEGNGIFEFTEIENRIKKLKTHLTYLKKEEKKL